MSALLEIRGLVKDYQGLRPLRIRELTVTPDTIMSIAGLDAIAAETFVHLVTGATLPDEGEVIMFGQDTRAITDGEAWLKSLDRVGMVTARAILIEAFSVLQNIAMSFTLDVDPVDPRVVPQAGALARDVGIEPSLFDLPAGKVAPDIQMRVHLARSLALARDVGIEPLLFDLPAGNLAPDIQMRVHLARALALGPQLLVAEHPSAALPRGSVAAFGADLAKAAQSRGLGLIAVTADDALAKAIGGQRLELVPATGELRAPGLLKKLFG